MFHLIKKLVKNMQRFLYTRLAIRNVKHFESIPKVNYKCRFNNNTYLGTNCHFNGLIVTGSGKVTIGDNFHSGSDCMIITQNHNIAGKSIPYDNTYVTKPVFIGDNVWLGNRVIILPGVIIGEGVVIQAGSVVVNNIPNYSIAGGHPAKVFATRDIVHYTELKKSKAFF